MKKIGLVVLALVCALGTLGVSYAHWSDELYIEGTVEMGDFLVGWEDILLEEDSDDLDKDVCDMVCTLEDPETGVHHEPVQTVYHTLDVYIDNGYPQFRGLNKVTIKNAGTIPAHIVDVIVTPGTGLASAVEASWDVNGNPIDWELRNADGLAVLDLEIYKQETELSLICNQLDPCLAEPVDVWVEIKQDGAEECHTYEFSVTIIAVQWNKADEYPFP
jgi:hypothetical protein